MWRRFIEWLKQLLKPKPEPDPEPGLPKNPETGPDLPGSISEHWTIGPKEYDQTWRIRWPSYFARNGIGPGTYCTVNGRVADFRSFDTDHGSKRPSYTMPLSIELQTPITGILYNKDRNAVAWFKTNHTRDKGRLETGG